MGKVFSSPEVYLTLVKCDQQMEAKEQVKKFSKLLLLLGFPELDPSAGWRNGEAVLPRLVGKAAEGGRNTDLSPFLVCAPAITVQRTGPVRSKAP